MVKVVQILWFESISPLNQPFIETPIGPVTPRQFILVSVGAILSYSLHQVIPSAIDQAIRLSMALIPFMIAVMTVMRPVKTIPPEKYLYLLIFGARKKKRRRIERRAKKSSEAGQEKAPESRPGTPIMNPLKPEEVPEEVKKVLRYFVPPLRAYTAVPDAMGKVEVVGQLKNPKTGAPLLNTTFYAAIGGAVFSGQSDERGVYRIRMYPQSSGSYYMIVAVQGFDYPVDSVLINVK